MELNVLGLQPRTFNCQLENVKSQKGYTFNLVKHYDRVEERYNLIALVPTPEVSKPTKGV